MPSSEERLEALRSLARILCDDEALVVDISQAWNDPERYIAGYIERHGECGVDKPVPDLAFLALIDGLAARGRCGVIDWREHPDDMVKVVRSLLRKFKRKGWKAPKMGEGEELRDLLCAVGTSLETLGLSLGYLNNRSDSYALVLLPTDRGAAATELATYSDVGGFEVLRVAPGKIEVQPPIRLRAVVKIDVEFSEPPRQVLALPRRRLVTFDGRTLGFVQSEGATSVGLDRELVPDFDQEARVSGHALFRSGQTFGVVSRQFVRRWSPSGESVLFRVDPPLEPNTRGEHARVVLGGVSDDPAVVVAIARRAGTESEDVHPVVLRLDERRQKARFDELAPEGRLGHASRDRLPMSPALRLNTHLQRTPRLGTIAWLDEMIHIVARGEEEGSPSYAVFSRYAAPFGQLEHLIDLGTDCTTRVSSSRKHLLVTYPHGRIPAGETCSTVVHEVEYVTRPPRPIELPAGAILLDHEDDAFWYFEPQGPRGRFVLAEPTTARAP